MEFYLLEPMSGEVGKQIVNISIPRRFYVSPTDKLKEENLKKYGHLKSHCIIIEMDHNGKSSYIHSHGSHHECSKEIKKIYRKLKNTENIRRIINIVSPILGAIAGAIAIFLLNEK